jgi:hypothetical protein
MRVKSLREPKNPTEGLEWLSPDGYTPSWHQVWQDSGWVSTAYEESAESTEETAETSTEDTNDERSMQAALQTGNGEGSGQSSEQGQESRVPKGGKGKQALAKQGKK